MTRNQGCRNYKNSGFTITETVVVMAITAVVLALLLPAMNRGRDHARTLQGLANLSEIGQTIHLFAVDNYGTLPYGYIDGSPFNSQATVDGVETDWMVQLNHYLAGTGNNYVDLADGPANNQLLPIFRDPNAFDPGAGLHHYTGHPLLMPDMDVVGRATDIRTNPANPNFNDSAWDYFTDITQYRLSRFRRPREVILAMDGLQRQDPGNSLGDTYATAFYLDKFGLFPTNPTNPAAVNANFRGYYDPSDPNGDLIFPVELDNDMLAHESEYVHSAENRRKQANVSWRQQNSTAANFLFPDGHTETKAMPDGSGNPNQPNVLKKRHIRIDR